jgi:hypothetical protein
VSTLGHDLFLEAGTFQWKTYQNKHIMAVEMHRVRDWCEIVDDESVASVVASVVDIPFRIQWIRNVALPCEKQCWVVVVASIRRVVHGEYPSTCSILTNSDIDCLGC